MRRYALVLAGFALFALALADSLRTQVNATNQAVHKAIVSRDIDAYSKAMKAVVTKDFKYVYRGRSYGFDKMVADAREVLDAIPELKTEEAIPLSLVIKKDTATGTTEHKVKGHSVDSEGAAHQVAFYGTSVETYRKVKGKWLLAKQVWRTRQILVDGKAAPQG